MTTIRVEVAPSPYDVVIEPNCLDHATGLLAPYVRNARLIVVYDLNVAQVLRKLSDGLAKVGVQVAAIGCGAGEEHKGWADLQRLVDELLRLEVERGETIVALGGGVIGDLAGFAAAIVKRGCQVVQIPTTLLAQVDSSVGGKTGINTAHGKNLVGVFHQPTLVLVDPAVLATLPAREMRAGYAEIAKYGLLGDERLFAWCEANAQRVLAGDLHALTHAIAASVSAKAAVVAADTREFNDRRALLNLGHTFGHALEAAAGYDGSLLHGEAVAAGMCLAYRFSASRGLSSRKAADRVTAHFAGLGLPTDVQTAGVVATGEMLVRHIEHDKKKANGRVSFILVRDIGQAFVARDVQLDEVAAFLEADAA